MKKLFYILILITGVANAQIVNIPDANFKAKLIQAGVDTNSDAEIQESEALVVNDLYVSNSNISSLVGIEAFSNLTSLQCEFNNLTSLNVNNLTFLETLFCSNNQLTTIELSGLSNLWQLQCHNNQLTTINVSGLSNLSQFACYNNQLTSLNLVGLINLDYLGCSNNQIQGIIFDDESNTTILDVSNNLLTTLKISSKSQLPSFNAANNQLTSLFLKVEFEGISPLAISGNPNLEYICTTESDIELFQSLCLQNGYVNCVVNSYCTFTPSGNYNTIVGQVQFDEDNNGCDVNDGGLQNVRINITDGTETGATFSNTNGGYTFYSQALNHELSVATENPTWFTVSPELATVSFTDINNNQALQNFCITPNGVHPDLEIVITPINPARPGFDATYKIVYRNKGNQTLSQQYGINFFYNQNLMEYVSASVEPSQMALGGISWDYVNLQPFESREIVFTLNINAPTDTNPVNNDDVLTFTTSIMPQAGDENTADNTFVLDQTVVGSYDPNDITCLEGDIVLPTEIGEYLHYNIRFENTGTFYAENIVVKTEINPAEFDINTLQLLNASHPVDARIRGNIIEFIFQGIYLDTGGHGNVLLKLKTKPTLQTGDLVKNKANIYFDYNFPILTNDAETVFQSLNNPDFEIDNSIKIYPNPSNAVVNIKSDFNIKSIQLYDVQGRILQTNIVEENTTSLDITSKARGIYFLKVITERGIKVEKLVKE